jgi:hypothetical protein
MNETAGRVNNINIGTGQNPFPLGEIRISPLMWKVNTLHEQWAATLPLRKW